MNWSDTRSSGVLICVSATSAASGSVSANKEASFAFEQEGERQQLCSDMDDKAITLKNSNGRKESEILSLKAESRKNTLRATS